MVIEKYIKDKSVYSIEEFNEVIKMRNIRKLGKGRKKVTIDIMLGSDGYEVYIEGNRVMDEYIEKKIVDFVMESKEGKPYF